MRTAAIYARYSTDDQRPTSIEDQVRQCTDAAEAKGFKVEEKWIFADRAISGGHKGSAKRAGFRSLLDAIEARQVSVIFVDEVSRVARNELDGARLSHLADTMGLRIVVVSDGIDSAAGDNWKLTWSLKLLLAVQQNQSTAKEVTRGMIGQLERGFMIAQAPIGYSAERIVAGRDSGTRWHIEPRGAEIVRKMYKWRCEGMSLLRIATRLNEERVACPGAKRCKGDTYWRPATVARILGNTIYKGLFVWNGSSFTRAKARIKQKEVVTKPYPRPELRLVSDEVWSDCNPSSGKESIRGGGRYAVTGVVRCGHCNGGLSFGGGPQVIGAYCAQCAQAKAVNGATYFIGYTTLHAVRLALEWGLKRLFTGAAQAEFKQRLRARLSEGPAEEIASLERQVREAKASLDRLQRLLADPRTPEDWLRQQLIHFGGEHDEADKELKALRANSSRITPEVVEAQIEVDPLPYLEQLLQGEPEVWRVRKVLKKLIARFQFKEKGRRGRSVFELEFKPGELVAELSDGPLLDASTVCFRIEVDKPPGRQTWEVSGTRI
jgi:site-specific DNA recombinase